MTGASGGMGAEFTKALAKRGYPVLAVARGVEPLARLANELKKAMAPERRPLLDGICPPRPGSFTS